MPDIRCLACRRTFKSTAIHSHHLSKLRACQNYYDEVSTEQAQLTSRAQPQRAKDAPAALLAATPTTELRGHVEQEVPFEHAEPSQKRRRVTVEEVMDEDNMGGEAWEYTTYEGEVATPLAEGTTFFEAHRKDQQSRNEDPHAPFQDEEEWGLVQWLMKNTTQGGVDSFAKLPIVSLWQQHHDNQLTCPQDSQPHSAELQEQAGFLQAC